MDIPILSYTWAAGEKGRWGWTAVLVASSCQLSLVRKPCLLLWPLLPPPSSEPPPPSLTSAIALIISNYTWSHVPEISSWPGWKVTWQIKGKNKTPPLTHTSFLLPQHKLIAQLQVWKGGRVIQLRLGLCAREGTLQLQLPELPGGPKPALSCWLPTPMPTLCLLLHATTAGCAATRGNSHWKCPAENSPYFW